MAKDAYGNDLVRDVEAALPKIRCKIVARARDRFPFTLAGGYCDRDGKHVHAHKFRADGRERTYEFTVPMIKRLQHDRFLDITIDPKDLVVLEKGAAPSVTRSELDAKNDRIAELESQLKQARKPEDPAVVQTDDGKADEPEATTQLQTEEPPVDDGSDENPKGKKKNKEAAR